MRETKTQHGVPTQFLNKRIKLIFGRDKWIKLKYWWGQDKIKSGFDQIKNHVQDQDKSNISDLNSAITFKFNDWIRIKLQLGKLHHHPNSKTPLHALQS